MQGFSAQQIAPRTVWSTAFVTIVAASVLGAGVYLLLCVIDGYWIDGTYGFLVLPGFIALCIIAPEAAVIFWAHAVRGFPVIGFSDGQFHYLKKGRKAVAASEICLIEVRRQGRWNYLSFVNREGQEIQKYPLVLSPIEGMDLAKRARAIIEPRHS